MKNKNLTIASVLTFVLLNTAYAQSNESFAVGIVGVKPMLWQDYEPIQKDALLCFKDNKKSAVCDKVQENLVRALWDSLRHATLVNSVSQNSAKFCDKTATESVKSGNVNQGASYAMLLVEEQLKYGTSLYGSSLKNTYLSKIVYDALLQQSPCKK